MKDYKKALEFYRKLYNVRAQLLGEEHAETLSSLHSYALCHKEIGDYISSLSFFEKVYVSRVKTLGENDPKTIKTAERIKELKELLGE
ncbi:MAG: tetratricopeptide repeat protein [Clostridia bacterium]|nr:tetratricopeptide repeat protein [Clostridia bacterium]